ncbi:MAG: AAA family ATPase, partial [Pyrinomonadaceae bacterium]|nr:AAA family ATPase [Pyrinomonadaceae bacterium]
MNEILSIFTGRQKEIKQIFYGIEKYNNVIIEGLPGVGKTTLMFAFIEIYKDFFDKINYYHGYELELDKNKLILFKNLLTHNTVSKNGKVLWVIDDLDSIISSEIKDQILNLFARNSDSNNKIILITRPFAIFQNKHLISNVCYKILLEGLNKNESEELIAVDLLRFPLLIAFGGAPDPRANQPSNYINRDLGRDTSRENINSREVSRDNYRDTSRDYTARDRNSSRDYGAG